MFVPGGDPWVFDQRGVVPTGADPNVLVEWSNIIEKRAIECCRDRDRKRLRFTGSVNKEGRFALELDVRDSEAMVCLLNAIQDSLGIMPSVTREYYGALMVSLATEAEKNEAPGTGSSGR